MPEMPSSDLPLRPSDELQSQVKIVAGVHVWRGELAW
ncbi:hypothetical protein COLO4_20199 [Corchorus olitorius]|uniref:Uncharacterized protein n=1 Tax=Corchorus olitorius TaxID=93759 RepID=A0A1R3J163_9ROSI|nr:hypothetical protein COLO4_20199 [Corchorus olitorius]